MHAISVLFVLTLTSLGAKPYSGRVKIADETLIQAKDAGIDYGKKLDAALDGPPADFTQFIRLIEKLDTSGAYFHFFHIYEVAEQVGDKKLRAAIEPLPSKDLKLLVQGLSEAHGWLKRKKTFATTFPETTAALRKAGIAVDF
jgi:hypothetical protein